MTTAELVTFYFDDLNWCGCGDPWGALSYMGTILNLFHVRYDTDDEQVALNQWKAPLNVLGVDTQKGLAYSYLYLLDAHHLTDHGSSIRGCWLTEKGEAVMNAILDATEEDWDRAVKEDGVSGDHEP